MITIKELAQNAGVRTTDVLRVAQRMQCVICEMTVQVPRQAKALTNADAQRVMAELQDGHQGA